MPLSLCNSLPPPFSVLKSGAISLPPSRSSTLVFPSFPSRPSLSVAKAIVQYERLFSFPRTPRRSLEPYGIYPNPPASFFFVHLLSFAAPFPATARRLVQGSDTKRNSFYCRPSHGRVTPLHSPFKACSCDPGYFL